MYWPALAPALFAVLFNVYVFLVRPAQGRQKAKQTNPPEQVSERREPRDLSRPYPKPADVGPDEEHLSVCPVCGMEDPLFLDGGPDTGELMGWPAHGTCLEWLGDWKPAPPPFRPDPELITYTGAKVPAANGMMTMDEFREGMERLSAVITTATGIPGPSLAPAGTRACDCGMCFSGTEADIKRSMDVHYSSLQHSNRLAYLNRMKQALPTPVTHMWCTCGKPFDGTPEGVKQAMDAHHASGECPHSARHREAMLWPDAKFVNSRASRDHSRNASALGCCTGQQDASARARNRQVVPVRGREFGQQPCPRRPRGIIRPYPEHVARFGDQRAVGEPHADTGSLTGVQGVSGSRKKRGCTGIGTGGRSTLNSFGRSLGSTFRHHACLRTMLQPSALLSEDSVGNRAIHLIHVEGSTALHLHASAGSRVLQARQQHAGRLMGGPEQSSFGCDVCGQFEKAVLC